MLNIWMQIMHLDLCLFFDISFSQKVKINNKSELICGFWLLKI